MFPRLFLIVLIVLTQSGCQVELFRTLSEGDANRVYRELERSGIEVKKTVTDKRKGFFGIEVARGQASRALEILRSKDLPRRSHRGFGLVTEGGNLLPSPRRERLKYHIALAGELEETLENLPGVQYARVHFALPRQTGIALGNGPAPSAQRASVVLKVQEKLFQLAPKDVQALVAGALPDIKPEAVSVVVQLAIPTEGGAAGYASLGPFSVSPSSRLPLLITLIVVGLLLALLIAGFVMSRRTIGRIVAGADSSEEPSPRSGRD